ncbi:hypothetical protein N7448_002311 [Penicillium atrosanguineum]|uniref:BZIP domain-containing protein n=1 Tax=Penicillium atrosanguineum TaxID=1132637 RepID=A0A9W9PVQ8_9EURO|nr:hypothetical protein N7448_002311 [Penicillium atrosanguineum]KAJ5311354.1 hypothetical protein N7476_007214 [Penicillium atrosanguineum]
MPPQTAKKGESAGQERRKPVRRDPEKRRQQNIEAQRKYPKIRERLNHLEAVAAGVTSTGPPETLATPGSPTTSADLIATSLPTSDASIKLASSPSVETPGESQHLISQTDNSLSALASWESIDYSKLDDSSSGVSLWDATTKFDPLPDYGSSLSCEWGSTTYVDPSFLIRDNHDSGIVQYWTTSLNCGCSTRHIQIQTKGVDPSSFKDAKILTLGYPATTADPYANNLRIDTVCTAAALRTIGMQLGVNEEALCADESLSPFFRFTTGSVDFMVQSTMIKTVQQTFKSLKPDLRPSREQITVKHHPCIDVLPFPTLRNNFITHQDEFDEDELFMDVFNGLVCWGGAGIGKRDRDINTGYVSTGTPWDVRSWEAKQWFLKKYWVLLGGEDGELVRQSEWWRGIRGEETLSIELPS